MILMQARSMHYKGHWRGWAWKSRLFWAMKWQPVPFVFNCFWLFQSKHFWTLNPPTPQSLTFIFKKVPKTVAFCPTSRGAHNWLIVTLCHCMCSVCLLFVAACAIYPYIANYIWRFLSYSAHTLTICYHMRSIHLYMCSDTYLAQMFRKYFFIPALKSHETSWYKNLKNLRDRKLTIGHLLVTYYSHGQLLFFSSAFLVLLHMQRCWLSDGI